MKKSLITFDSEKNHYFISEGMLEINKMFIFNSTGIKFILTPHAEGEHLIYTEIILKEHKTSNKPYRLNKFYIDNIKSVSAFFPEELNNQYNIETHNLFIYCDTYKEYTVFNQNVYDKVKRDDNDIVIQVSRKKCLELDISYLKGMREMSKMYLPESSYFIYKTPKEFYIAGQTLINNFKIQHLKNPEKDNLVNLLFGNPCIEVKLKTYEEEL